MTSIYVPFNRPTIVGAEFAHIQAAIDAMHISGDGAFTKKCQQFLEHALGVKKALLTTSCTDALELSALLLDIQPGDEVIVPAFTFVSTVNAFVLRGAKPVFVDVRPDTLNLDERLLESLITPKTKAIVPVHYAGVGCEMDAIMQIANQHNIAVVEDNAHGLFGKYKGRFLGTFGDFATQSFHETKNFTCGEGGALLINSGEYVERAEILREKGTDRSRFFRGQVDKYTWVDVGSSFLPADMLSAYLYGQFEAAEEIQTKRNEIWERYHGGVRAWADRIGVQLPTIPEYCEQSYHMFYMLLPTAEMRSQMIQYLKERDIISVFHYLPLHLSRMGQQFGGFEGQCPVTEDISERLLRLPFFFGLTKNQQTRIIASIREFKV